jgi:hypothetical protein
MDVGFFEGQQVALVQHRIEAEQTSIRGDDVGAGNAVRRPSEAIRVRHLAAEIETAQEREDFRQRRAGAVNAPGEVEIGFGPQQHSGALAGAAGR